MLRDRDTVDELKSLVSEATQAWPDLHWSEYAIERADLPEFPSFEIESLNDQETLLVRTDGIRTYLCSVDGRKRMAVKASEKRPFGRIADDYRFSFIKFDGRFQFNIRSPKDVPTMIERENKGKRLGISIDEKEHKSLHLTFFRYAPKCR